MRLEIYKNKISATVLKYDHNLPYNGGLVYNCYI